MKKYENKSRPASSLWSSAGNQIINLSQYKVSHLSTAYISKIYSN